MYFIGYDLWSDFIATKIPSMTAFYVEKINTHLWAEISDKGVTANIPHGKLVRKGCSQTTKPEYKRVHQLLLHKPGWKNSTQLICSQLFTQRDNGKGWDGIRQYNSTRQHKISNFNRFMQFFLFCSQPGQVAMLLTLHSWLLFFNVLKKIYYN